MRIKGIDEFTAERMSEGQGTVTIIESKYSSCKKEASFKEFAGSADGQAHVVVMMKRSREAMRETMIYEIDYDKATNVLELSYSDNVSRKWNDAIDIRYGLCIKSETDFVFSAMREYYAAQYNEYVSKVRKLKNVITSNVIKAINTGLTVMYTEVKQLLLESGYELVDTEYSRKIVEDSSIVIEETSVFFKINQAVILKSSGGYLTGCVGMIFEKSADRQQFMVNKGLECIMDRLEGASVVGYN